MQNIQIQKYAKKFKWTVRMQKPTKWECKKQSSGEIQQNAKDIQENTLPTFARFRSGCTSVLTVVKHSRMKTKRRMSETQIEKKQQRDTDRLNCFQQNKRAEELACGMAVRNAKLEQLGHKVEDQELITISAKAASCRRWSCCMVRQVRGGEAFVPLALTVPICFHCSTIS